MYASCFRSTCVQTRDSNSLPRFFPSACRVMRFVYDLVNLSLPSLLRSCRFSTANSRRKKIRYEASSYLRELRSRARMHHTRSILSLCRSCSEERARECCRLIRRQKDVPPKKKRRVYKLCTAYKLTSHGEPAKRQKKI